MRLLSLGVGLVTMLPATVSLWPETPACNSFLLKKGPLFPPGLVADQRSRCEFEESRAERAYWQVGGLWTLYLVAASAGTIASRRRAMTAPPQCSDDASSVPV